MLLGMQIQIIIKFGVAKSINEYLKAINSSVTKLDAKISFDT